MRNRSKPLPSQNSHSWIVHLLLFSSYPVLSHLATNINEVEITSAIPSLLVTLLLGICLKLFYLIIIGGNRHKAALLASGTILIIFSYGHLRFLTYDVQFSGIVLGRHRHLLIFTGSVFLTWFWFIRWRLRGYLRFTAQINIIAVLSNVVPVIIITSAVVNTLRFESLDISGQSRMDSLTIQTGESTPDVYYIVLDGYAREDALWDVFRVDNSEFIQDLEERGFFIGDNSYSNYNRTLLSLASSLNMIHVQDMLSELEKSTTRDQLEKLIKESHVVKVLRESGYQLVAFETGFRETEITDAEYFITFDPPERFQTAGTPLLLNDFEASLLETTIVLFAIDSIQGFNFNPTNNYKYEEHRNRVLRAFQTLEQIPLWDGDYFIFAHIISPHPPFVFSSEGKPINPSYSFTLSDANDFLRIRSREEYIQGYREQITYLNTLIIQAVDGIIQNSDELPIIILQADHGPGAYTDFESRDNSNLLERYAILNAYYFQGKSVEDLYSSISPVNSFRVVINNIFGGELTLQPDSSYFAEGELSNLYMITNLP